MKKFSSVLLCAAMMLSLAVSAYAAGASQEAETAGAYLRDLGVLHGDVTGDLMLEKGLTRAELAAILTRLTGNPEHVDAERDYYTRQCGYTDVPDWARLYVGFCTANGYMVGYGNGTFGAYDPVAPAAACTVTLRYMEHPETDWTYDTAVATASEAGLVPDQGLGTGAITRGEMVILLYRALGNDYTGEPTAEQTNPGAAALSRNEDGSINLPSDGSRYVPQAGDVIRCDDGTNYTITDVSRYDKNMFASGPVGELPKPTCDWSLLEQPELPEAEARHYTSTNGDCLYIRNLYETRRMLYTLYNAIGANPETWEDGAPKLTSKGNQLVHINLSIPDDYTCQMFWPWRESEIVNLFNSVPPGTYSMQVWDVYYDGIFQRTEYQIHVI